jgi:hypothetical protein
VYRGNEPGALGTVAQGLPQFRNTVRQHAIAHRRLGPHRRKQSVFRHQLAGVGHQDLQHRTGFARQGDDAHAPAQLRGVRLTGIGTKVHERIFQHVRAPRRLRKLFEPVYITSLACAAASLKNL